jgi:hypothetical protein
MLPAHHTDALANIVNELVPRANQMMPRLRRRLAAGLARSEQTIRKSIRSDVGQAMMIFGRTIDDAEWPALAAVADEVRDTEAAALEALVRELDSDPSASIAPFFGSLVEKMKAAMTLHGTKRLATDAEARTADLRIAIEGDTAFRTLRQILDVLTPLLDELQPRSMLAVRSS